MKALGTSSSEDGVGSTGQGAFSHSAAQTEMSTDAEKKNMLNMLIFVHTAVVNLRASFSCLPMLDFSDVLLHLSLRCS